MSPVTRVASHPLTLGVVGAAVPVLLALGLLVWQGAALAERIPATAAAVEDHEARLRTLEADRARIVVIETDVRWIRESLEQQAARAGGPR